jgi:ligand-binding sensor domain-containing protein
LNQTSSQNCIDANAKFSFPVTGSYSLPTPIPLGSEWIPQLDREQSHKFVDVPVTSMIIQPDGTLWFAAERNIVRYNPRNKDLFILKDSLLPSKLLAGKNGETFGIYNSYWENPEKQPYYLSRFDEDKRQFLPVEQSDLTGSARAYSPAESGRIWFVSDQNEIKNYDPADGSIEKFSLPTFSYEIKNLAVDKNETVWLLAYNTKDMFQAGQIIRFDPRSNKLDFFSLPFGSVYGRYLSLYIDHSGRLWTDDYGYLDNIYSESPVWYQVVRSPIFIHNRWTDRGEYQWSHANPFYETKDGLIWFFSMAGLANLDMKSQKWCLVTTVVSSLVEDNQGNQWIVHEGQIYKKEK